MKKTITFIMIIIVLMGISTICNSESVYDAGDDFSTANNITTNTIVVDNISKEKDVDFFKFDIERSGLVSVELGHDIIYDSEEVWIGKIYNQYGEEIYSCSFAGNKPKEKTCEIGLEKGRYYLRLSGSSRVDLWNNIHVYSSIEYSLKINFIIDENVENELNNDFKTATDILFYHFNKGSLKDKLDCDFYKFEVTEAGNKCILFSHPTILEYGESEIFEIRLYNSAGDEIKYISSVGNKEETKEMIYLKKGIYYIRIGGGYSYSGHLASQNYTDETYSLCVYEYIDRVIIEDSKSSCNSITLTWHKLSNVTGYRLFVKTSTGWKTLATLQNNTYTAKDLTSGTKYTFAVRAYTEIDGKTVWAPEFSTVKATTQLGVTTSLKSTTTHNSVSLKWNAVKGATGYRVFVKNGRTGKWDIAVRTTGKKTTATIKNLEPGTKYTFAVRAYLNNGKIVWAPKYKSINTVTKPGVTDKVDAISTENSVTLKWSKVAGATGYRVYIMKDGKWKALKTTTGLTYTATGLTAGTKCTFAVKAYTKLSGTAYWASNYARVEAATKQ